MENFMFLFLFGMATLENFNLRNVVDIGLVVNQTLKEINSRIEELQRVAYALRLHVESLLVCCTVVVVATTITVAPPPPLPSLHPLPQVLEVVPPSSDEENMESFCYGHILS